MTYRTKLINIRILNSDVINAFVFTMLIANGNHMLVLRKKLV